MNKLYSTLLIAALCCFSGDICAQYADSDYETPNFQFGIKAGVNVGAILGPFVDGGSGKPVLGPNVGVFMKYRLSDRFSFQPEVMYCYTGVKFSQYVQRENEIRDIEILGQLFEDMPVTYTADATGYIDLHYIDVPLQMVYRASRKFDVMFGPRFAYLVKGEFKGEADVILGDPNSPFENTVEPIDESDQLRVFDIGLTVGGAYNFTDRLAMSMDVSSGLTSVNYEGDILVDKYFNFFLNTSLSYTIF